MKIRRLLQTLSSHRRRLRISEPLQRIHLAGDILILTTWSGTYDLFPGGVSKERGRGEEKKLHVRLEGSDLAHAHSQLRGQESTHQELELTRNNIIGKSQGIISRYLRCLRGYEAYHCSVSPGLPFFCFRGQSHYIAEDSTVSFRVATRPHSSHSLKTGFLFFL